MPLVPLRGHEPLQRRLRDAVQRGSLPASLLLHGPRGIGKQRLALWLGQMLLCDGAEPRPCGKCAQCRFSADLRHPDLHWFFPRPRLKDADPDVADVREDYAEAIAGRVEAKGLYPPAGGAEGIFVATVRAISRVAVMSPAMARRKVLVIGDAERMVPQEGADMAANAFLKLLEEPPADTSIVLTSSEPGGLLPTIRSRIVAMRVPPVAASAMRELLEDPAVVARLGHRPADVDELLELAGGAPGRLLERDTWADAARHARRILDAALARDAAERHRVALAQGGSKARGSFSDALDALVGLLHQRMRAAAGRDDGAATAAARAVTLVEEAKERAAGNLNPQLVTASLMRELGALLG